MSIEILLLIAVAILVGINILIALRIRLSSDTDVADRTVNSLREEFRANREESNTASRALREELSTAQDKTNDSLVKTLKSGNEVAEQMRKSIDEKLHQGLNDIQQNLKDVIKSMQNLEKSNLLEQEKNRGSLDKKITEIRESNEKKLEEMRVTVDEKLQGTLEKRLGDSFKIVSERLEAVQKGLGEMQSLASGVGDLKRVLTNVKERGTWAEYQLGDILEQFLTQQQYEKNVSPKNNGQIVEFAIKLPGRSTSNDQPVWLPIDAKFPNEDYQRLMEAAEAGDSVAVQKATKDLGNAIKKAAKDIHDKYIEPPDTTDFGVLFLPTEGLYSEVLRQPGLQDEIQQKHRILVAGPTTLSALLNSLRVGFQTLAIEDRAREIWDVLGAVKTEFSKYGQVLDRLKKQLNTASKTVDESQRRTRSMERALKNVEQLPVDRSQKILGFDELDDESMDN